MELHNGRTERRIRLFAGAWQGFLITRSVRGASVSPPAFTLVDHCLLLGLDLDVHLVDVLDKLERGWALRRLSDLTPHRWPSQQSQ